MWNGPESGERTPKENQGLMRKLLCQEDIFSASLGSRAPLSLKQVAFPYCLIAHQEKCPHCLPWSWQWPATAQDLVPPTPLTSSATTPLLIPSPSPFALLPINKLSSTPGPLHMLFPLMLLRSLILHISTRSLSNVIVSQVN